VTAALAAVGDLGPSVASRAFGVARATLHRYRQPQTAPAARPPSPRRLTDGERQAVLAVLHSDRFVDKAPAQIYATLLDEGTYLCSERTMYRILVEAQEVRERRDQLRHPQYKKPELLATGPNQVWSWDITKLKGPVKWTYFYLYVILDIFSRFAVGWMVASRENATLAEQLIGETIEKQAVDPQQLTIHADRGPAMKAQTLAQFLAALGTTKSHSRPYTSTDNPFSEAQFRTLKYMPAFPDRFGSQQDSIAFCRPFFRFYNFEHRHGGIGYLTPAIVHYGQAQAVIKRRHAALADAYAKHPERFVRGKAAPRQFTHVPNEVWINPPTLPKGQ